MEITYQVSTLNWPRPVAVDPLRAEIVDALSRTPLDFGGGCSASKAFAMAALIRHLRLKTSLDIGVYRGRSLVPMALAHLRHTGGMAFGVDPYTNDAALQVDHPTLRTELAQFAERTDFEALYRDVDRLRHAIGVAQHCTLVRETSAAAARRFREQGQAFGLIHIDGNHDTAPVLQDVDDYLPLLEPGGILVMDDVSWDSVKPAYARVAARMPRLFQRTDPLNDYAVFLNAPLGTAPDGGLLRVLDDEFVRRG
jgi:hypothetical protein